MRQDFRENNQIRPLAIERNLLSNVDGSGQFSIGGTSVMCSMMGPIQPRFGHQDDFRGCSLEVRYCQANGRPSSSSLALEGVISSILSKIIVLEAYPHDTISLSFQEVMCDGGLLPCSVMAALLALVDGGVELIGMPVGVSIACSLPNQETGEIEYLVDPTLLEEEKGECGVFTAFFLSSSASSTHPFFVHSTATLSLQNMDFVSQVASTSTSLIESFISKSLQEQVIGENTIHGRVQEVIPEDVKENES